MENCTDLLNSLDPDMAMEILTCLNDISDVVRAAAVSRSWQNLVIASGVSKRLCLRIYPQLSRVSQVIECNSCEANNQTAEVSSSSSMEWKSLKKDHMVYSYLARACETGEVDDCILDAIVASSTDNYPEESIQNTLDPRDLDGDRALYWSSKGQSNPAVPETLTYKLISDFCVITEIDIQPFRAFFQLGLPIYSAKFVRFRMGHLKCNTEIGNHADDKFTWTYTSQEFPMTQESSLQKFKLPEPVLCIGGIVQIELLGRVQRQEMDNLYYICVAQVHVRGWSLSPALEIEILDPSGTFALKSNLKSKGFHQLSLPKNERRIRPGQDRRRARILQQIVNMLRGDVLDVEEDESEEEDDVAE